MLHSVVFFATNNTLLDLVAIIVTISGPDYATFQPPYFRMAQDVTIFSSALLFSLNYLNIVHALMRPVVREVHILPV